MFSDHNPVFVNFSTDRNPKGPGYWRFPTPLLKNTEFITALKLKIKEIVNLHRADSNPALLWETVKLSIREEVSKFLKMDGLRDKEKTEEIRPLIVKLKQFMIDYLEIDPQQFNACNYLLSNFSSTAAVVTATLFKRHILITKINKKDSSDPKVSFLEFLIVLRNYIKKDLLPFGECYPLMQS